MPDNIEIIYLYYHYYINFWPANKNCSSLLVPPSVPLYPLTAMPPEVKQRPVCEHGFCFVIFNPSLVPYVITSPGEKFLCYDVLKDQDPGTC